MNTLKKVIMDTMITTGASIVLLSVFFVFAGTDTVSIHTIFEIFGANIVINCGLLLICRFESRFVILEYLLNVSYIIAVLVVFGVIFDWYSVVPVWLLVVMAVVIDIFMIIITTVKIRKYTKKINGLLQKRREKQADSAP